MPSTAFLKTSSINKVVTGPSMFLGHVALLEKEDGLAERYFLSVIGSDTKSIEAHFLLGYLSWKNNDFPKMKEYFSLAISYSKPEKATKGVLSEGDTRDGQSYLRPINVSLFHEYFNDLNMSKTKDISKIAETKYAEVDKKILNITHRL